MEITRQKIIETAEKYIGYSFRHQARGQANSVDCVGLLVCVARDLNYPNIVDATDYRRVPSASVIRQTLLMNCDEITLSEMKIGDIFLMRLGGLKPRHAAIFANDKTDIEKGISPSIIHASASGVRIEPLSNFPQSWFVSGFRMRGVN